MSTALREIDPAFQATSAVKRLLEALGEDPQREGLRRTPERVARAMSFLISGAGRSPSDVLNGAVFEESYEGLVLVKDIEFYSLCEHHLLPFHGSAHIAYLPAGRVLGLSKLPRLLEVFSRRLQVQERLTRQVAQAVEEAIRPRGVAVMLEAVHFCMMMRGVEKQESTTSTFGFLGEFESSPSLRSEFLTVVRGAGGAAPAFPGPRDLALVPKPRSARRRTHPAAKQPRGHRCEMCRPR